MRCSSADGDALRSGRFHAAPNTHAHTPVKRPQPVRCAVNCANVQEEFKNALGLPPGDGRLPQKVDDQRAFKKSTSELNQHHNMILMLVRFPPSCSQHVYLA